MGGLARSVVSQVLRRLQDLVSSERSPLTDKMFVAHNPMQPQTTSWAQPTPPDMYFSKNASSKDARFWGGWRLFDTISTCSNMLCTNISAKNHFVKIFGDDSFNMSFNTFNIVFPPLVPNFISSAHLLSSLAPPPHYIGETMDFFALTSFCYGLAPHPSQHHVLLALRRMFDRPGFGKHLI